MRVRIAIVGAGFSGLGMAIRLKQEGFEDFVVLERASEVGGTWRDTVYPGCACDIPSHLYSFSFAPNPDWRTTHASQADIWTYLRRCADRFGVRSHIRFDCEMTGAEWDDDAARWRIATGDGGEPIEASMLIAATGPMSQPVLPRLPGLEGFAGRSFHSAEWDPDHDFAGEHVAVIGAGASAVQIVPELQRRAARVTLFLRSPPWIFPRGERRLTRIERGLYRRFPALQRLARGAIYANHEMAVLGFTHPWSVRGAEALCRAHLRLRVRDRELRRKLTPTFRLGCKRTLTSNAFYPALTEDNVEVVTEPIAEVRRGSLVTGPGTEHEVDTIVFGTGYDLNDPPFARLVRGRDGRSLREVWGGSRFALRGLAVAGFPNLFVVAGPHTGIGHSSLVYMMESQFEYVLGLLRHLDRRGLGAAEARPEAVAGFERWIATTIRGTTWADGCRSHYLDHDGRNTAIWPTFTFRFRRLMRRFEEREYVLSGQR